MAFVADEFTGIGFEKVKLFVRALVNRITLGIKPRIYNTKDFDVYKDPFVCEIFKMGIEMM